MFITISTLQICKFYKHIELWNNIRALNISRHVKRKPMFKPMQHWIDWQVLFNNYIESTGWIYIKMFIKICTFQIYIFIFVCEPTIDYYIQLWNMFIKICTFQIYIFIFVCEPTIDYYIQLWNIICVLNIQAILETRMLFTQVFITCMRTLLRCHKNWLFKISQNSKERRKIPYKI